MGMSTIEAQIEKVFRHTRQNSFATRDRYKDSCRQFAAFLHERFKVQNIRNLSDKHVVEYVQNRQQESKSAKTIKNDLAAIRYLHDQVSNPRYTLSDNKQLKERHGLVLEDPANNGRQGLDGIRVQRDEDAGSAGRKSRSSRCNDLGTDNGTADSGSRSSSPIASRDGASYRNLSGAGEAKNGKHRSVRLSPEARGIFERRLQETPRGGRLFVPVGEKTHRVVNRLEKFLAYHRHKIESTEGRQLRIDRRDEVNSKPLTFHGLRYNYVQQRMNQEQERGFSEEQASAIVSQEVGHERTDVIAIYQGGK